MSHGGFSSSPVIERIAHLVPDRYHRFHEGFILTRAEATEWWELIHEQSPTMAKVAHNIGSYLGWSLTPPVVARYGLEYQWWRPHMVAFWAYSGYDLAEVPGWCKDSRNPMPVRAITDALRRLLPGWIDPDPEL